ncbi:MAG: type II toxin-antitoxin system VapC family toxin [Gemmatimonadales bacterium]|nr:MAG: type II toxin-antitoxin system VapC family toxin [Gemmatimonadales bacterium]
MKRYVLDSNLYIEAVRDAGRAEELKRFVAQCLPSIYLHAAVAQELLAGAVDHRRARLIEESLIRPFERRERIITPRFGTWKRAGRIMARLVQEKRMSAGGFGRSFVNDCLLGASCREDGFALITRNTRDFKLIQHVEPFDVVEPWPV